MPKRKTAADKARDDFAARGDKVNYGGRSCEFCTEPRKSVADSVLAGAARYSEEGGTVTWGGIWTVLLAHLKRHKVPPPSVKMSSLQACARHHRGSIVDELNMPRSPRRVGQA